MLVSLGLLAALSLACQPIHQPLAFNHRLHVEEVGAECTDCHLHARTGVRATIPNLEVCAECHEEALTDSEVEARLVAYIQEAEPIPWQKVYWVPDHVYFSHRRHTAIAEIECETCHGPMREREQPVTRAEADMTMEACMACHQHAGASNDCLLCHR
ncbi:MAG TPA: cytochrome c3 family protein [Thermoanaerobaculia bacterium]|nr:cytochrome c3 family protein [Thermoanaerobaculia bacterium]